MTEDFDEDAVVFLEATQEDFDAVVAALATDKVDISIEKSSLLEGIHYDGFRERKSYQPLYTRR